MSDILKSATQSLGEHTRKLEIATYYTHDDIEKAKQMVSGTYSDMYVIKAKLTSSTVYCAYVVFLNKVYQVVEHIELIVSNSYDIADMKTNIGWKVFEQEILTEKSKGLHDSVIVNSSLDSLAVGIDAQFVKEIIRLIENNEEISVNHSFKKLSIDKLGFQNVEITVDYDEISSLDMELFSKSSKKINLAEIQKKEKDAQSEMKKVDNTEKEGPLAGREVKMLLKGSMILSPIKGKPISTLIQGDRVKVSIVDNDSRAIDVAKAFDAYDDEKKVFSPINGRVIFTEKDPSGGYKLYIIVAKGIYLEIEEDEDGIKVAMDPSSSWGKEDPQEAVKKVSAPMIVVLLVVLVGLIAVILQFIK